VEAACAAYKVRAKACLAGTEAPGDRAYTIVNVPGVVELPAFPINKLSARPWWRARDAKYDFARLSAEVGLGHLL
jgi:hypothetical protein